MTVSEVPVWIPYANLVLNFLIVPLIKILWDMKVDIARLAAEVHSQNGRVGRLERIVDEQRRGN